MQEDQVRQLKFVPPSPPAGFVSRPRLTRALARGLAGRLILLQAPAGYGKTSLLASMASEWTRFVEASAAPHLAWYRLDPSDDDAAAFLGNLVEAVHRAVPGFGSFARGALEGTPDARDQIQRLISILLDELREAAPAGVFLVLDGFHLIKDRVIVEAIEQLLQVPEPPLRLIVSTQSSPRFYLSALRARDELVELRAEDLRMTTEEVRELVLRRGDWTPPQKAIDDLARLIGGWPSAANLASLIMARDRAPLQVSRVAPTEHGYGLLLKEALSGLPAERKDGLLRTSLLRYLDVPSCGDGAGVSDPIGFLRFLEGAALPLMKPAGHEGPLSYEPLFRSALERELASMLLPHEFRALQQRVASFYASQGAWDEAIRRYLQAGDFEGAATAMEGAIEKELAFGHLDVALRWLRALPSPIRERHPALMVHEARLLLSRDRLDEARVLLVAAQPGLEDSGVRRELGQQLGGWAALRLLEGRYEKARELAQEALEQLPQEVSSERAEMLWLLSRALELMGDLASAFSVAREGLLQSEKSGQVTLVVRAMLQLGHLAYLRGSFAQSLALSARAVQRSALSGTETLSIAAAGGTASLVYLERGQPEEALETAKRSLKASQKLHDAAGQVRARLALAAALERLGQQEISQEVLEKALHGAEELPTRWPEPTQALQAAAASLWRRGRRREGAEKARLALQAAQASSYQMLIDQGQLVVTSGEMVGFGLPRALVRIRRLNEAFRRGDSRRWLSAGLRLLAQGFCRMGLRGLARTNLRSSLALAAEEPSVGMPLGLPTQGGRLLALAVQEGIAHEVAGTLLGVDGAEGVKVLTPLLAHKNPEVRTRAEQAIKGLEKGLGRAAAVRLPWPGFSPEATGPFPAVLLHSLGGLEASVEGQKVGWPSLDARDLVAYLLVHRAQAVPRDRVLHDLWPNEEPSVANLRLHEALYRVRETLGPGYPSVDPLLDGQGIYRWDRGICSVDAELFLDRLGRVREHLDAEALPVLTDPVVSLLEGAVDLYRGEFLSGFEFEWCEAPREELRAQLLWATRLLIDHYMALRDWRAAIGHGLKSLRSDPLQEDAVRDLMVCYFRVGERDSVLQQYREVKRLLARERGVWPSEETRALRQRLLGNYATRAPNGAPPARTRAVARAA